MLKGSPLAGLFRFLDKPALSWQKRKRLIFRLSPGWAANFLESSCPI
jgi:hypothetical protein